MGGGHLRPRIGRFWWPPKRRFRLLLKGQSTTRAGLTRPPRDIRTRGGAAANHVEQSLAIVSGSTACVH